MTSAPRKRDIPKLALLAYAMSHALPTIFRKSLSPLVLAPPDFGGLRVALDPFDPMHMLIAQEICWSRLYDFKYVPFEPELTVDCGAHVGFFCATSDGLFSAVSGHRI